jgi:hypothetical protein
MRRDLVGSKGANHVLDCNLVCVQFELAGSGVDDCIHGVFPTSFLETSSDLTGSWLPFQPAPAHRACAGIKQENKRLTVQFAELLDSFLSHLISRRDPLVQRFLGGLTGAMRSRLLPTRRLPCERHLAPALAYADGPTLPLLRQFVQDGPALNWGQTYSATDLGRDFLDNYGWVELLGTRGHFENDLVAGGFLVLGPNTLYPDHHHLAEELYVPLTGGTEWRKGDAEFKEQAAGTLIHHASNVNHAMRTADAPLVAIYLWRGGPLAAKSTLS